MLAAVGNRTLLSEEFVDAGRRLWVNLDPDRRQRHAVPGLAAAVRQSARCLPGRSAGAGAQQRGSSVTKPRFRRLVDRRECRRRALARGAPTVSGSRGGAGASSVGSSNSPACIASSTRTARSVRASRSRFHDPAESDLRGLVERTTVASAVEDPDGSLRDTSIERRLLGVLAVARGPCRLVGARREATVIRFAVPEAWLLLPLAVLVSARAPVAAAVRRYPAACSSSSRRARCSRSLGFRAPKRAATSSSSSIARGRCRREASGPRTVEIAPGSCAERTQPGDRHRCRDVSAGSQRRRPRADGAVPLAGRRCARSTVDGSDHRGGRHGGPRP